MAGNCYVVEIPEELEILYLDTAVKLNIAKEVLICNVFAHLLNMDLRGIKAIKIDCHDSQKTDTKSH